MNKKVISAILAVILMFSCLVPVVALTESEASSKIESDYKTALRLAGRTSFYGYCTLAVAYQLTAKGIYSGTPDYTGSGSKWYSKYADETEETSGGYTYITIGGSNCITELIETYGDSLSNIVVSYGTGGTSGSTHSVLISYISDGYVYYTDSFAYGSIKEGETRIMTVSDFIALYKRLNGNPYGLVMFYKDGEITEIEQTSTSDEETEDSGYVTGIYMILVDDLNVRSGPSTSYSVIGQLNTGDEYYVSEIQEEKWAKIDYNGEEGWFCLYSSKDYAVCVEPDETEEDETAETTDSSEDEDEDALSVACVVDEDGTITWIASVQDDEYSYMWMLYSGGELLLGTGSALGSSFSYTPEEDSDLYTIVTVTDTEGNSETAMSETVSISVSGALKGDADQNGVVDVLDSRVLLRCVLSLDETDASTFICDVTCDGKIDLSDVQELMKIALGLSG